jgi:hypothetical protein
VAAMAAKPNAARIGTMAIMERLYRVRWRRTIELLVMNRQEPTPWPSKNLT